MTLQNTYETEKWTSRTELLIGESGLAKLAKSSVLVVGLGGVGAFAAEFLCRAGIGKMAICDFDIVRASNRNRQLPALIINEGKLKTDLMAERLFQINPDLKIKLYPFRFEEKTSDKILSEKYDYVIDAIDSLSSKVFLIADCVKKGFPIISSMGAGEKLLPALVRSCWLSESFQCPLARLVRKRLHKLGIKDGVKVVFSPERPVRINRKTKAGEPVGSISYMPAVFAIHCVSEVIKDILAEELSENYKRPQTFLS